MTTPPRTTVRQAEIPRRHVRLMADYTTTVLWEHDGAPLDPNKLQLSARLCARLDRWRRRFESSLEKEIDLEAFAAEGLALARAVKKELPDWSIVYFDEAAAARAKYEGSPSTYEIEIP